MNPKPFRLETLVDFPDDALRAEFPITEQHIDSMMATLAKAGVQRVSWATYADGHGGYRLPVGLGDRKRAATYNNWLDYSRTLEILGNPLRVAVEAGHRHGLEVYGYFKPYETGPGLLLPEGSPEAREFGLLDHIGSRLAWLDPFVVAHPNLRIRHRGGVFSLRAPICSIQLIKKDDSPTRITKEHLQFWSSSSNYRYQRMPVAFNLAESTEPAPHEVLDLNDKVVSRKGEPRRVLTLSGFQLRDPYILVTTDFCEGPADFENVYTEMMVALDAEGREIPGVFANGTAIWLADRVDFRNWGLIFDHGWGRSPMRLDEPNESGKNGFIGYTRGRSEYLTGALCETEPAVQAYWLTWIREMLDDGVDGIDIREENHSTHTEFAEEYGFNPIVLDRCAGSRAGDLRSAVAQVRGDAYMEFLRQAKRLAAARGKRFRYNLNVDFFRDNPAMNRRLAFPANLHFDWRRWVDEGLLDEAVLRFYTMSFDNLFQDELAQEMVARSQQRNIPITMNRYISYNEAEQQRHQDEFKRVQSDGRFAGFVLYETDAFMEPTEAGGYSIVSSLINELCRSAQA